MLVAMVILLALLVLLYLFFRFNKLFNIFNIKSKYKVLIIALPLFILSLCINNRDRVLYLIYFIVISLLFDLIYIIASKFININSKIIKLYASMLIPLIITIVVVIYGTMNMKTIVHTEYNIITNKNINNYSIVLITDTHYGTIQDVKLLDEKIIEINKSKPDIVVLGGDIVEEGTTKEKMKEVFKKFSNLNTKYGVYYVYGNHDLQTYSNNPYYTKEELVNTITSNGITILDDKTKIINNELVLIGRDDAKWGNISNRKSTSELIDGIDKNKYLIVLDHQPIEANENGELGIDLQLSGHTHAGQIFPIGLYNEITAHNNYGLYDKNSCKLIVSSGFTGWGFAFRNQKHCEYVTIHLGGK